MIQSSQLLLFAVVLMTLIDFVLLYLNITGVSGRRMVKDKLSNFDKNPVKIQLENHFPFRIKYTILDEIPEQFQIFDFKLKGFLSSKKEIELNYDLIPSERGVYKFGDVNVFVSTPL